MTKKDLLAKVEEYESYKALLKETEKELERLEAELKKELDRKKVEELAVGDHKVRYTTYVSTRFDSKSFKADEPALFSLYSKEVQGRRFSVV